MPEKKPVPKQVDAIRHNEAKRLNIPTAELESVMRTEDLAPVRLSYKKRNPDLDPQLVWRGKYDGDDDLNVFAPPLYIQEKIHPKALIEDLLQAQKSEAPEQLSLFADFNGLDAANRADFYRHEQNWTNRMILGDSLQVMASLAEREGLRGKVQCIYLDPPYGIKFNSNFQWSTTSRDVRDGRADNLTREPEQVRAFRDTWRDGIHSYLSYLRDRFLVARDLLAESGSIFVQIGDENVHRVRAVMDEVFGEGNFVSQITIRKTTSEGRELLGSTCDYILWFTKNIEVTKFNTIYDNRSENAENRYSLVNYNNRKFRLDNITSSRPAGDGDVTEFIWFNLKFNPGSGTFKTTLDGLFRIAKSDRFQITRNNKLSYIRFQDDFCYAAIGNLWNDISGAVQSRSDPKIYVVQTSTKVIERCILMATDPGDLVLDPTCGSGTTAYVAEQWGRRWITIDTSRVALALARARLMGARYPWYILADSRAGREKEAALQNRPAAPDPTYNNIRLGFVCERVPHITLKSIANNAEIDVIWDKWQKTLEPLREALNKELGTNLEEWEIPREIPQGEKWTDKARSLHGKWWQGRLARQGEIDASIAARADYETLFDRPYEDKKKVRVAGPFTVESLSPYRTLGLDANGETLDPGLSEPGGHDFAAMILENLKISGVQQAHKADKIEFTSLTPWPGNMICAEGRYLPLDAQEEAEKRAAIFIGPEFGTVSRQELTRAAREAAEAGFDIVIALAFNYEAQAGEFSRLGRIPIIKARMNADLHMAGDLKNTGKGNLFVVFGEPDIDILPVTDKNGKDTGQIRVRINGVDVFYPNSGEIISDNADGIACWFVDTEYNDESFFVRQAYFPGAANDPYKALKTSLKAEIDRDAWESLRKTVSRPFVRPKGGRIAVKVINHLGDEVMKVFDV